MSFKSLVFKNPDNKYRINQIIHSWPKNNRTALMDAIKDFGYGGVVTNVPYENGFTSNLNNIIDFKKIIEEIKKKGLTYWIYDEKGYPSGYADGMVLDKNPDYEAKGFYMIRKVSYQGKKVKFHIDDETDKIIWVAKYPIDCSEINDSIVQFEKMIPINFNENYCECKLNKQEVLFIFCVKPAYEGSHCTHNVCSHSRYINIMDTKAVKKFLELCYEPILKEIPNSFSDASAVFTDEPSLQNAYILGYEEWPYALAPWVEGLFEEFKKEYGFSILPYLPLIFEGKENAYTIRIKFYNLIAKLVSKAYTEQISKWCKSHGTIFSGHYLGEESILAHVNYYGSYIDVLKKTGYPGIDVLASYPEIYNYNTAKFAQMVVMKNKTNGMMAELCPYTDKLIFEKNPMENMIGIINLLYIGGCRVINSYFATDYASYNKILKDYTGYINKEEAIWLNKYAGRLAYILDNVQNDCNIFIYYPIEDVQAKLKPSHLATFSKKSETDVSVLSITKSIYEAGYDYLFADSYEIIKAANRIKDNKTNIYNNDVKVVIVPPIDIIEKSALKSLIKLGDIGVKIFFIDKIPEFNSEQRIPFLKYDFKEELDRRKTSDQKYGFISTSKKELMHYLHNMDKDVIVNNNKGMILKARYIKKDKEIYFIINNSRENSLITINHKYKKYAKVFNPDNGNIQKIHLGKELFLKSFRGIFLIFDKKE